MTANEAHYPGKMAPCWAKRSDDDVGGYGAKIGPLKNAIVQHEETIFPKLLCLEPLKIEMLRLFDTF